MTFSTMIAKIIFCRQNEFDSMNFEITNFTYNELIIKNTRIFRRNLILFTIQLNI